MGLPVKAHAEKQTRSRRVVFVSAAFDVVVQVFVLPSGSSDYRSATQDPPAPERKKSGPGLAPTHFHSNKDGYRACHRRHERGIDLYNNGVNTFGG